MAYHPIKLKHPLPSREEWIKCHQYEAPGLFTFRKLFTELLQYFFSDSSHFAEYEENLECLANGIKVEPGSVADPGNTENVPGVIISIPEGIEFSREWMDADPAPSPDYSTHYNTNIGKVRVIFVCRHYDANIAGMMADAVTMYLTGMETLLKETYHTWLMDYKPVTVTEPKRARKAENQNAFENWYEATSVFELTFTYIILARRESKRLKAATTIIDAEVMRVDPIKSK